ncbi:MAG: TolC family protein [Planctomycetes bacterium]|nr:TolC family protein [Planctomycetota bacterium]
MGLIGCKSPAQHREKADDVAYDFIRQGQQKAFDKSEDFTIERPADLLRRRLLVDQKLPYTDESSLGSDKLPRIEYWPDPNYLDPKYDGGTKIKVPHDANVVLSLLQALQIGAWNSFNYQTQKEGIFRAALLLDLEANDFRNIFNQEFTSLIKSDTTGDDRVSGIENSSNTGVTRKLENGTILAADLAIDFANLLTSPKASALGTKLDTSISIPLLRGSGKHIVTEPLTQAQRNVVYAIYSFERFKRTFAVDVSSKYLDVLRDLDEIDNNEKNYRNLVRSVRKSRRLADLGRLPEIQVDQALQSELRARNGWIAAIQRHERSLDDFKILLGLPTDARIQLDRIELDKVSASAAPLLKGDTEEEVSPDGKTPSADAPITLALPGGKNPGPLEMDRTVATRLALDNRLDLRIAVGEVYDAQRDVVVAADDLRGELTLLGEASSGANRSIGSADSDNAKLRADKAEYFALLTLDLPIERTEERDNYRNSLMVMEKTLRDKNLLEDQVKLDIRNRLRTLLATRETIQIQVKAVHLAQKRVKSTELFLDTGRAEVRDLLEAQESLLSAQNALTSAFVTYRTAELELQRDMGLLKVASDGLLTEYTPENTKK